MFIKLLLAFATAFSLNDPPPGDDVGAVLIFSQPQFAPGDTAFFTGHLLTGAQRRTLVDIVLVDSSNHETLRERFWFEDGLAISRIIIPADMNPGLYKLVLFIEYGAGERVIPFSCDFTIAGKLQYVTEQAENMDPLHVDLKGLSHTYVTRDRVNLEIGNIQSFNQDSLVVSASVYRKDLFPNMSVAYTLTKTNAIRLDDSLRLLGDLKYPFYFAGQVVNRQTGLAAPDSLKVTFYLNDYDLVYSVFTRPNGAFRFPLFQNFNSQEVFYVISNRGSIVDGYEVVLVKPAVVVKTPAQSESGGANKFTIYNRQRRTIQRSFSYFNSASDPVPSAEADSFEGDHEVRMDKYEPFRSMEEVIINVVPMVRFRKESGSRTIRMFLKDLQGYAEGDPIFIVDGVMTDNTDAVLQLDPELVQKIIVLRSAKYLGRFGDLGTNGILVLETTNAVGVSIGARNSLRVQGVNAFGESAKQPETRNPRTPDLRHVLYWNPAFSVSEGRRIEFTTSDDTGAYIIELVAISGRERFIMRSEFNVVRPE